MCSLKDVGVEKKHGRLDWWGNITFAIGLVLVLVGINDGIQPYGTSLMAWGSPRVLGEIAAGLVFLGRVLLDRDARRNADDRPEAVPHPAVHDGRAGDAARLDRPRRAAVHADRLAAGHLAAAAWLLRSKSTPLWAGIFMLPLTVGRAADRAGLRLAQRPIRAEAVRGRRHGSGCVDLPRADVAPCRLRVLDVRRRCCSSTASARGCSRRRTRRRR